MTRGIYIILLTVKPTPHIGHSTICPLKTFGNSYSNYLASIFNVPSTVRNFSEPTVNDAPGRMVRS